MAIEYRLSYTAAEIDEKLGQVTENTEARHTHDNKKTLDGFYCEAVEYVPPESDLPVVGGGSVKSDRLEYYNQQIRYVNDGDVISSVETTDSEITINLAEIVNANGLTFPKDPIVIPLGGGSGDVGSVQFDLVEQANSIQTMSTSLVDAEEETADISASVNLFNKEKIKDNYIVVPTVSVSSALDGEEYPQNNYALTNFIKVKPNTSYTITGVGGGKNVAALYDKDKSLPCVKYIRLDGIPTGKFTFTTTEDTQYLRVNIFKGDYSVNTYMVCEADKYPDSYVAFVDGSQIEPEEPSEPIEDIQNVVASFNGQPLENYVLDGLKISKENVIGLTAYNAGGGYPEKMAFIGDSLTYGSTVTGGTPYYYENYYNYPYFASGKLKAKEYTKIAIPGGTSTTLWTNRVEEISNITDSLAVIFLGTNNGLSNTIEADCSGDDLTSYANTLVGNYGKIIKTLQNNGNKVVLCQCFHTTNNLANTNATIVALGERFGCDVVLISEDTKTELMLPKYHTAYNGTVDNIHFNNIGHLKFAEVVCEQITQFMFENPYKYEMYKSITQ